MIIGNATLDHIEVYDETGRLVVSISDDEIIKHKNYDLKLCETDKMFTEEA